MSAEIARLPTRPGDQLSRARALRDEARDSAIEVAELLSGEVATLADRCAEAAMLDTMPGGLRDAFRKLAMSLESQNLTIGQIMSPSR